MNTKPLINPLIRREPGVTRAAGSQRVPCVRRPRACAAAAAGGDAPSSAAGAAGADGSCAAAPPPPPPAPRGPRTAAAVAAERRAKFAPPAADRAAAADGGGASTSGRPPAPWGTGSSGGQQRPGAAPAAARPGGRGVPAAQDKTRLTADESADIARRLRAAGGGPAAGRAAPLRLYRYALDDLRLLKALDQAGLEGRVVVVDSADDADVIVASRLKRTGKQMDLNPIRRAAAARGVPFVVLPAVSALRVAEALAPLLGEKGAAALAAARRAGGGGPGGGAPRVMSRAEVDRGNGDALMRLLWCAPPAADPQPPAPADPWRPPPGDHSGGAAAAGPAGLTPAGARAGAGAGEPLAWRAARMPDPWAWLAAGDAEDGREDALPPNPTERASARYPEPRRPLRHGSRVRRRKLEKHLAELDVDW